MRVSSSMRALCFIATWNGKILSMNEISHVITIIVLYTKIIDIRGVRRKERKFSAQFAGGWNVIITASLSLSLSRPLESRDMGTKVHVVSRRSSPWRVSLLTFAAGDRRCVSQENSLDDIETSFLSSSIYHGITSHWSFKRPPYHEPHRGKKNLHAIARMEILERYITLFHAAIAMRDFHREW